MLACGDYDAQNLSVQVCQMNGLRKIECVEHSGAQKKHCSHWQQVRCRTVRAPDNGFFLSFRAFSWTGSGL